MVKAGSTRQDRSESHSQLFPCVASSASEVLGLSQWLRTLSSPLPPPIQSYDPLLGPLSLLTVETAEQVPCLP